MKIWIPLTLAALLVGCGSQSEPETSSTSAPEAADADEAKVVVYSSRQPHLIEPLFERYTEQTGVAIEFTNDNEASPDRTAGGRSRRHSCRCPDHRRCRQSVAGDRTRTAATD